MARSDPPPDRPPGVDALARSIADVGLPHPLLVDAARRAIAAGDPGSARPLAERQRRRLLMPVVNATGVLLHTNLGRAPLAVTQPARPGNLELDLDTGARGARAPGVAELLAQLTGSEDALVVNNGAAAVLLVLTALASGRAVIVSRGELVEIGGGFRIPDVLATTGARLVEVGTTNRTRLDDYRAALDGAGGTGADPVVLKVHQSNYRIVGFTESVPVEALATLGVTVVADIGSGLLDATTPWLPGGPPPWLATEPAARQTLAAGADVVTFSGDKLLGGPQAGVVAGRREVVAACRRHPLARALRPGGLVLGALERTLLAYARRDGAAIAFWRMATADVGALRHRAEAVAADADAAVVACRSTVGGGALPGVELPSAGVAVDGDRTADLRRHDPPVLALSRGGRTVCDLRTVDPGDDGALAAALKASSP